ncbi:MAG: hypothetical protein NTU83_07970, partial [Candidatus Hydrogenedentes bacterium]|nr:hypothetical protein [Candidatus Hydrogenedentota bacterium]
MANETPHLYWAPVPAVPQVEETRLQLMGGGDKFNEIFELLGCCLDKRIPAGLLTFWLEAVFLAFARHGNRTSPADARHVEPDMDRRVRWYPLGMTPSSCPSSAFRSTYAQHGRPRDHRFHRSHRRGMGFTKSCGIQSRC